MIPTILSTLQEGLSHGLLDFDDPARLFPAPFPLVLYVLDGLLKSGVLLDITLFLLRLSLTRFVSLARSGACGINRLLRTGIQIALLRIQPQ